MAILKSPPRSPKNETLQIRVEEQIKAKFRRYAGFINLLNRTSSARLSSFCFERMRNSRLGLRNNLTRAINKMEKAF